LYYLINFNDFGSTLISIFTLIMVGNWGLVVRMFEDVMETKLVRIYFVSFYILSVVVLLNIVVAFVLEMYESVKSKIEDQITKDESRKLYRNLER
jgi:two pore calcium channel protein